MSHRLSLKRENKIHVKKADNSIELEKEIYQNNPLTDWQKNINKNEEKFIALIPIVRNLAEYCNYKENYKTLTSLLHQKKETNKITISQLAEIMKCILNHETLILSGDNKVIDKIYQTADKISEDTTELQLLERKIVISIAIRLKAEEFIQSKISEEYLFDENQTYKLVKSYKKEFPNELAIIKTLDNVNLMTPENIHLNSFMYEPILDMSGHHLVSLYKDVKKL